MKKESILGTGADTLADAVRGGMNHVGAMRGEPIPDGLFVHPPGCAVGDSQRDQTAGPFAARTSYIIERVISGQWREARLSPAHTGLTRDLWVFLASRRSNPIVRARRGDRQTICPLYWDLAIGSGPCGLGCRGCFLLGTFRSTRDPLQPLVYDNVALLWEAVRRWLIDPRRCSHHTLGLGADRCDSLLFEELVGHARQLIPMFADPLRNPNGCKLFLLTKSTNVHHLGGLPTDNTVVSFSLNPERMADLWEGKWPDTLERITPLIERRLAASLSAQRMGFEVRWRLDPILTPRGWQRNYREFLKRAAAEGHRPTRVTLGTYRQTHPQLDRWRRRWALPAAEWHPPKLARDGTHWHIPASDRVAIYRHVASLCAEFLPHATVALCKETSAVRREAGLCSPLCNCTA